MDFVIPETRRKGTARKRKAMERGIMGSHYHIQLGHLPWPVSVLTFNGAVSAMRSGDDMIATIRDPDVVGNICLLLGNQPDLRYEVREADAQYHIQVIKGPFNH